MSHRHIPRQPERSDIRMHDPQPPPVHPHHLPPHPQHPHINGSSAIPSTPSGLANGSAHAAAISPAVQTAAAPNGAGPSTIINKLNSANEQTWLLIGML
jgi:glucose repression mediator protein